MATTRLAGLGSIVLVLEFALAGAQTPDFGDDASVWSKDGECDDPRFTGSGMAGVLLDEDTLHDATDCRELYERGSIRPAAMQVDPSAQTGVLDTNDSSLSDGEYFDEFSFEAKAGQLASIELRSSEFDTYLLSGAPDGEQLENDDLGSDQSRSSLTWRIEDSGTYDIYVTSYEAGETGRYSLDIQVLDAIPPLDMRERGELSASDTTLESGEFYDTFSFLAEPGDRIRVDLNSNEFDTYLIVVPPTGEQIENDDADSASHSSLDFAASETGRYVVYATSYSEGETGDYLLTIAAAQPDENTTEIAQPEVILVDSTAHGTLDSSDSSLDEGEFRDLYTFSAEAGQAVRVELRSADFDTWLAVMTPSDDVFQNDDFEGAVTLSSVALIIPETGTYTIIATSYDAGETGEYSLSLESVEPASVNAGAEKSGRIYGLFAGISDYPGKNQDLNFTADDAVRLRDAMVAGAGLESDDQITLIDADATRSALRLAIEDIGRRARPEDTFVFFFSGHGDRVPRPDGPQVTDPDALDETIELYDGAVSDDELRDMLAAVHAGTSLIFLDSCFSGGFAKDLISVPGRMGLFSSEEDVASSIAAKFQAGGYLALFLADAIQAKLADSDGDGAVSAIELSQYVYERYRGDVKASGGSVLRSVGARAGHQHLVVDRGSIGPYDILFR